MVSKRLYGAALMAAIVIPALTQGCSSSSNPSNPLCCSQTDYSPGATVGVSGSVQAVVAVQAIGDFSAIAAAAVDDLTTACRNIATDLDGTPSNNSATTRASIEAVTSKRDRMSQYCSLAKDAITASAASGTLTVVAVAPKCEASVSASASCNAKCKVDASCDVNVTPPKCTGGDLQISCSGSCNVTAEKPSITCEGSCQAACTGSCTVNTGSVECAGKCEGTCAAGGAAGGSGIQADGTCKGMCTGTCEVVAPSATCSGSCKGSCSGSCKATGGVSAKCDGSCDVKGTPISCTGGKLEGGCMADAQCDANCNASVQAKAECTPPSITVKFTGLGNLQATLEANLPRILAFKSRLSGMGSLGVTITGNATAIADIKAACIPVVLASAVDGVSDVTASASATVSLATSAGAGS